MRSAVVLSLLTSIACFLPIGCNRGGYDRPNSPMNFRNYLRAGNSALIAYSPRLSRRDDERIESIRQDLSALRVKFDGLILYGSDDGTSLIIENAIRLRYRAILLTIGNPQSQAEIALVCDLIGRYSRKLVLAVSVGSEGILLHQYSTSDLRIARQSLLSRLAGRASIETTTSEPWWLYLDGQPDASDLRGFGDFVTINVHVVWDADILDPVEAARWTRDRALTVLKLSNRPVLVREAGFPGGGTSPRPSLHGARFSRDAQAGFWRAWLGYRTPKAASADSLFTVAVFEAIDNSAKTWADFESEWGLLSTSLDPHPAWKVFPFLMEQ